MVDQVSKVLIERLTGKEKEILYFMSIGYTNSMIGEQLNLQRRSVVRYISTMFEKLDMEDVPMTGKRALAISIYDQTQEG